MTLWQLDANYLAVMEEIDANAGELTPELESRLDQAAQELVQKQDGYIKALDMLDTYESQAKHWKEDMAARIQRIQNQKDRLKNALILHLHAIGQKELRGELGKVRLMKTVKVGRIDESLLPGKYKQLIQEIKIDKRKLLDDLKSGPVEGAVMEEVEFLKVI